MNIEQRPEIGKTIQTVLTDFKQNSSPAGGKQNLVDSLCQEAMRFEPSDLGPVIKEIDEVLSGTASTGEKALALFLLSRLPPPVDIPAPAGPASADTPDHHLVTSLIGYPDFSQFTPEQKSAACRIFDLLKPNRQKDRYYWDNTPCLQQAYLELLLENEKVRAEFIDYLGTYFPRLDKKQIFPSNNSIVVGLLIGIQEAVGRGKFTGFDLASVYEEDVLSATGEYDDERRKPIVEKWKAMLSKVAQRKNGILGPARSLHSFTQYSSVYRRYESPGGANSITRALLAGTDQEAGCLMDLGPGSWILDVRDIWPGDVVGVDKTAFGPEVITKTPWRIKDTTRQDGSIRLFKLKPVKPVKEGGLRVDDPGHVLSNTVAIFSSPKGIMIDGNSISCKKQNFAKEPLPVLGKPVAYLLARGSVWNTAKGVGRIRALENILSYSHYQEGAIVEIVGFYFEKVRSVGHVYLQKTGDGFRIIGLRMYDNRIISSPDSDKGSTYIFFKDRLSQEQLNQLECIQKEGLTRMKLIGTDDLPNLISHLTTSEQAAA